MRRPARIVRVLAALLFGAAAQAAEYTDRAEVVHVEPLRQVETRIRTEIRCVAQPRRAPRVAATPGADMIALLDWNEAPRPEHCHEVEIPQPVARIDGYRVTYRYLDRTFTRILDHPPGATVPVRVRLTPAGP